MRRKWALAYIVLFSISMPLANPHRDLFIMDDCEIQVTNKVDDKSIGDILESADSVNILTNTFEIKIISGVSEQRCIIGADILKAFYKKNISKYSNIYKEQRYSKFLKDLIKESKLTRVEYKDSLDRSSIGKERK